MTPLPFYDQILTSFVPRRDGLHCEFAKELCESEKKTNSAPAIEFASQGKRRSSMPRLPCSQPGIKQDSPSLPASKQHHTSIRNTHRARSKALERVRQGNRRSVRGRIRFLCLVSQGGRRQLLALRSLTVALSISLFLVSLKKKTQSTRLRCVADDPRLWNALGRARWPLIWSEIVETAASAAAAPPTAGGGLPAARPLPPPSHRLPRHPSRSRW